MSIDASTVWEIRATGAATNGGLFADLDPGVSVDYSQQNSAQLTVSDLASDGAGTGISSATGGFTAAMVGNGIYITGGGFVAGWYQIVSYTDTNNITIDRNPNAVQTGGTGNVGGATNWGSNLEDDLMDSVASGNTVWMKSGTYDFANYNTFPSASSGNHKHWLGYTSTRGDSCVGTDRPLITMDGACLTMDKRWHMYNLRFTMTADANIDHGEETRWHNCKFGASGDAQSTRIMDSGDSAGTVFMGCEFVGTSQGSNVALVRCGAGGCIFIGCYFHGTGVTNSEAITSTDPNIVVINSVFASLGHAYFGASLQNAPVWINNVVYDVDIGIYIRGTDYPRFICNSIFQDCDTYGIESYDSNGGTLTSTCYFYNNGTDIHNGNINPITDVSGTDPELNDPANGDFTLASGSPCYNAGIGLEFTGAAS